VLRSQPADGGNADRASSATVAAATAASWSCLTTQHDRGSRTSTQVTPGLYQQPHRHELLLS